MDITSSTNVADSIIRIKALRLISAIAILILTFAAGLLISFTFSTSVLIQFSSFRAILVISATLLFFTISLYRSHRAIEMHSEAPTCLNALIPQWLIIIYTILICILMIWPQ